MYNTVIKIDKNTGVDKKKNGRSVKMLSPPYGKKSIPYVHIILYIFRF